MTRDRSGSVAATLPLLRKPLREIPFEVIVQQLYGMSVEKFDIEIQENMHTLRIMTQAMRKVCRKVQREPIVRQRPNEVGNDMEPFVTEDAHHLAVGFEIEKAGNEFTPVDVSWKPSCRQF